MQKPILMTCGIVAVSGLALIGIGSCVFGTKGKTEQSAVAAMAPDSSAGASRQRKKFEEESKFTQMNAQEHIAEARLSLKAGDAIKAQKHIDAVPIGTPGDLEIRQGLKKIRLDEEKRQAAALRLALEKKIPERRAFAKQCETNFLDNNLNVTVGADGPKAETLRIKWVLASRVTAHQIGKGDLLTAAKLLGFKKVTLSDGFNFGWTWDLTKE